MAQSVDATIALQEVDEATTESAKVVWIKAGKKKFEEAAHQKFVLQGKGVTWSPVSLDSVPAPDKRKGVTWSPANADSGPAKDADMDNVFTLHHLSQPDKGDPFFAQLHG